MKRANVTRRSQPVCHWCHHADVTDSQYRTPLEGIQPYGSVGWTVCSPWCPKRPTGAICYDLTHLMPTG